MLCTVEGCEKSAFRRRMCSMHYIRLRRHGDLVTIKPPGSAASPDPCQVEGCGRKVLARRYCGKHYQQWKTFGKIYVGQREISPEDRFWSKVDKTSGCWNWTGGKAEGYGMFLLEGRQQKAHRVAYLWLVGEISDGLQLDHLCRNRSCVRPDHLEPVTGQVNQHRGESPWGQNSRKTHCPHGHEYSPENTFRDRRGSRVCITCRRARTRAWMAAKRAKDRKNI